MVTRVRAVLALACLFLCTVAPASPGARRPTRHFVSPAAASVPPGSGASLGFPHALAIDPSSGALYIADRLTLYSDSHESAILRIDPDGTRTIVADRGHGTGTGGRVFNAMQIFVEPDGWLLYGMSRVDPATGFRETIMSLGPNYSGNLGGHVTLPMGDGIFLGGSIGLLRHDRASGFHELVSGCLSQTFPVNCVPLGSGPEFTFISAIAPGAPGQLFVTGWHGVIAVDLSTGDRTLVSGHLRGSGPLLDQPSGVVLEPSGSLLVANPAAILRIDPFTGDRTVVSDATTGAGPAPRRIDGLVLEPGGTLAYADSDLGAIVRVDLATGDRTPIAGGPIGAGPAPECVNSAAREATGAVVLGQCNGGILRMDLGTGDRDVVSDATTGAGPLLESALDVAVEPSGSLLVVDGESLIRVHPATGDRRIVGSRRAGGYRHPRTLAIQSANSVILGDDGTGVLIPIYYGWTIQTQSGLFQVDLGSGRGTRVSGFGLFSKKRGEGPGFLSGTPFLALVAPTAVATEISGALYRVDLVTGNRTLVSGRDRGTGEAITSARDLVVDPSGDWWVIENHFPRLWRVDPATGDRTLVSAIERGSGPLFNDAHTLVLDADGAPIVFNRGFPRSDGSAAYGAVLRVDPGSGDRTLLARY